MQKITVLLAALIMPLCLASLATAQSRKTARAGQSRIVLTSVQRKQALLILKVIDKMEDNLLSAWSQGDGTGLPTDIDRKYTEDAIEVTMSLADSIATFPDGAFKTSLLLGLLSYSDVGRIRVAAGENEGDDLQKKILANYGLQDVEPHLRAWAVLQVARVVRNKIAKQLGVPVRDLNKGSLPKTSDRIPRVNAVTERKRNLRSIKEVETDQISFVDRPVVIDGVIELSSYYNFGYRDTQPSHFAFRLFDGSGSAHVYMSRGAAADELRRQLLVSKGKLRGSFTIVIPRDRFTLNASGMFAELLDAGPPLK